jgi:uncharacterized surface protein with fasciclin (FAS1) repeats
MKSTATRFAVLLLAVGLIAAACSDDDGDSAASTTEATEAPATTDDSTSSVGTVVDVAEADGRFTTLLAAVEAAGLGDALTGDEKVTVFAPTDDAVAALPEGTVDSLLADPEGALTDILTYHVVAGEVPAADVVQLDGQEVETLQGTTLTVGVTDDGVTLTDATGQVVNVVVTDVYADNGVIHVIDAVLLPSA